MYAITDLIPYRVLYNFMVGTSASRKKADRQIAAEVFAQRFRFR
jgi:hypothetical protein